MTNTNTNITYSRLQLLTRQKNSEEKVDKEIPFAISRSKGNLKNKGVTKGSEVQLQYGHSLFLAKRHHGIYIDLLICFYSLQELDVKIDITRLLVC